MDERISYGVREGRSGTIRVISTRAPSFDARGASGFNTPLFVNSFNLYGHLLVSFHDIPSACPENYSA